MSNSVSRADSRPAHRAAAAPRSKIVATPSIDATSGRRERAKLERRGRIETAAREIFGEKGYQAATTREIAERADVGAGTLFTYARDKRELLLLIVNDELDTITDTAFATLPRRGTLLRQLMHVFAPHYEFWARDVGLSRHAVHETVRFVATSQKTRPDVQAARFHARVQLVVEAIAELIAKYQQAGAIGKHVGATLGATLFMDIFLSEIRNWGNGEHPSARAGLARLREVFALAIAGLKP